MNYLDELRKHVAELFGKATDNETVKQYAVVENETRKVEELLKQKEEKLFYT